MVKIDGGFVKELAYSELDHAMVRSIHEIARIAGKKTIAESVESIELIKRLKQIGIDFLQGHVIHSPEPLSELEPPPYSPPLPGPEPLDLSFRSSSLNIGRRRLSLRQKNRKRT
ncbi:MAG: EAL domain-containing protein [Wenzhouxiangellaceae bacterium]